MNRKNTLIFIVTLIAGIVIIAGGNYLYKKEAPIPEEIPVEVRDFKISEITEEDHLLGNPNADIILVEYSDFRCPYCKEFHITMESIMEDYGRNGDIAWVYRHFPNESAVEDIDSASKNAAIASECVASLGNEAKFWEFTSKVFKELPANFNSSDLRDLAVSLGIEEEEYNSCLLIGGFEKKIKKEIEDGLEILKFDSEFGTPYLIAITKDGKQIRWSGAQPYEFIEQLVKLYAFPDSI